jgi:hypothetical protein
VPRVVVVGTSGAGKSTVAAALAALYEVPHVDLDDLATGPRWTRVPDDVFRACVQATLDTPAWIIDGDYQRKLGNRVLEQAEMAIWLDLPLRVEPAADVAKIDVRDLVQRGECGRDRALTVTTRPDNNHSGHYGGSLAEPPRHPSRATATVLACARLGNRCMSDVARRAKIFRWPRLLWRSVQRRTKIDSI